MIDWLHVEEILFRLVCGDVEAFAADHQEERFYGIFIDCNAEYGDVLVHLNTLRLLHERANDYKRNHPDWYADKSIADLEERLRWSGGDWGYFEVNRREEWNRHWDSVRMQVLESDFDPEVIEEFMNMACRVTIRLESSAAIEKLPKTPDFKCVCVDHDETVEDAAKFLETVRRSLN